MGRKRRCQSKDDLSSSYTSSGDDELSTQASTPIRRSSDSLVATEKQRNARKRQDKWIRKMLKELKEDTSEMRKQLKILSDTKDDTKEVRKQLKKLTDSHNELRKELFHVNGSSGDDSAVPRSKLNQVQPPRYRMEFTCEVNDEIGKGQSIETKNHGKTISVAMYDDHNRIVESEPLASATVMLVVVNGEFNQHGNQYNWLRKDFERNIRKPRRGNLASGDVNHSIESIVSNCVFKLDGGVKSHTGATILCNSSNKKVRLGVMVLSPTQERVLEGLSNPFFVRGHDRPARQKQALVGYGSQERNGPMLNAQIPSWPILNQPGEIRFDPIAAANTIVLSGEPSINLDQASILQDQFSHPMIYRENMAQTTSSLPGSQFNMDQIARPVLLVWDKPNVELWKSGYLLDQLMPLYSCPPKFYNCCLPIMHLTTDHLGSRTFVSKGVMQTSDRKKGVLIEPVQPYHSDEERPLKRKLHCKYRLRFVNKVCNAYYTWEKVKASDGKFLKVALFDENNTQIASGPLASASVEVVVLHGDFNVDGQHYWSPQEFSRCVLHPKAGNKAPVLGGNRILALADGEACLWEAFFQITSCHARTGKFKMGVVLANTQDERIQEGISEPFRVTKEFKKASPSGFRSHPTDQELIVHYLRKRATSVACPAPVIPEVNIYKFEPWDLPAKATFGKDEWYFFCPTSTLPDRRAGSGYWKATGTDKAIRDRAGGVIIGVKKALIFYNGCPPKGTKTNWIMHEYRLADNTNRSTIMGLPSTSSSRLLLDWVLCRIYKKKNELQPSKCQDDDGLRQCRQHHSAITKDTHLDAPFSDPWLRKYYYPLNEKFSLPWIRKYYYPFITASLKHHTYTATAEPLEKLPAQPAQPQLEPMTLEISGNDGS